METNKYEKYPFFWIKINQKIILKENLWIPVKYDKTNLNKKIDKAICLNEERFKKKNGLPFSFLIRDTASPIEGYCFDSYLTKESLKLLGFEKNEKLSNDSKSIYLNFYHENIRLEFSYKNDKHPMFQKILAIYNIQFLVKNMNTFSNVNEYGKLQNLKKIETKFQKITFYNGEMKVSVANNFNDLIEILEKYNIFIKGDKIEEAFIYSLRDNSKSYIDINTKIDRRIL